jgi:isoleucyl-tRNA synthetase
MPFLAEEMYRNLVLSSYPDAQPSVHLTDFPRADQTRIDEALSSATRLAMKLSSLGRAARSAAGIKVRQPLPSALVVLSSKLEKEALERVKPQLLDELNIKDVQVLENINGLDLTKHSVSTDGAYSVAVSRMISTELLAEGLAREIVHRLQTMRKSAGFEISDRIIIYYQADEYASQVMKTFAEYIQRETLSESLEEAVPAENSYTEDFNLEKHPVKLGVTRL